MAQSKKVIHFTDLIDELHLDVTRRTLDKDVVVPSKKIIKEIVKSYEDLIILYLTTDHTVFSRMGKWYIIKKTFDKAFGKNIYPVTKYLPQLRFSRTIRNVVEDSTEQLNYLRDTEKIVPASQDHFEVVEWKLKDPQRDSTQ